MCVPSGFRGSSLLWVPRWVLTAQFKDPCPIQGS